MIVVENKIAHIGEVPSTSFLPITDFLRIGTDHFAQVQK